MKLLLNIFFERLLDLIFAKDSNKIGPFVQNRQIMIMDTEILTEIVHSYELTPMFLFCLIACVCVCVCVCVCACVCFALFY